MERSNTKQKTEFLRYAALGASLMLLGACAVVEPEPEYGEGPYGYGPPVYYSAYPYYAAPPPVVSFGFGVVDMAGIMVDMVGVDGGKQSVTTKCPYAFFMHKSFCGHANSLLKTYLTSIHNVMAEVSFRAYLTKSSGGFPC